MRTVTLDFLLRIFRATAEIDFCDCIWWRTDGEYAPVTVLVNCNDLFEWALADAEEVTPDSIALFEKALVDAVAADPMSGKAYGPQLFCARVRGCRPQGGWYEHFPPKLAELFDACGPERDPNEPCNTPRSEYKGDGR